MSTITPKLIELCETVEQQLGGSTQAGGIAHALKITSMKASNRLSAAVTLGVMTTDRSTSPRLYRLVPTWRDLIAAPAAQPVKTYVELACAVVQKLGLASVQDVARATDAYSNMASGRLKGGLEKGWLKRERHGKVNLYAATAAWLAHCAPAPEAEPEEVEETRTGRPLQVERTVPEVKYRGCPLRETFWRGLGMRVKA